MRALITLVFCSIQYHFIRHIRAKFGTPNSSQSPDIGQNQDGGIYDFRISGESFIKEIVQNSRTSHDIDTKLGPVTKLYKRRNKTTSKKLSRISYRKIVTKFSLSQFMDNGAIRKPDSGRIVCKIYIFINSNLLPYKDWKQN